MTGLAVDLKLAFRGLRRRSLAVAGAVTSLALGFAAQIAVLSCVNAVLWKPLAAPEPDRVATVYGHSRTIGTLTNIAHPHLDHIAEAGVFEGVAAFTRLQLGWDTGQGVEKINVEMVSGNYFDVVRPRLELGRAPREAGEVLLGYGFWRDRFQADRGVAGRAIPTPSGTFTITGVAARDFRGTLMDYLGDPKLWLTLESQGAIPFLRGRDLRHDWVMNWFVGAARLKEGVTVEQAQQAVSAAEERMRPPADATPRRARVFPAGRAAFHPEQKVRVETTLAMCAGMAGLLLLLGCVNAGVFLAGKALGESGMSAMERALGASAANLARRRFVEAAMVCGAGAAVGTLLAVWWVRLLEAYPPPLAAIVVKPEWDWRVWTATLAWTAAAAVVACAAPAWIAVRAGTVRPAGRPSRVREWMAASQIAVAAVILAAAGFVLRSVMAAGNADLGFRASGLVMAEVDLFGRGVTGQQASDGVNRALALLRERPEVEHAASASLMPLTVFRRPARVRDSSGASMPVYSNAVSAGYFRTLELPLRQGRVFAEGKAGAGEAVVNETLARALGGNALGSTLEVLDEDAKPRMRLAIVGIARDAKYHTMWQDRIPYFYTSSSQAGSGAPAIVVRARAGEAAVWEAIRDSVRAAIPQALVSQARTSEAQVAALIRDQRYLAVFFSVLGGIAMLVAAGGLMASLYMMVDQRTREMGIRQALGATRSGIARTVAARGLAVACCGLAAGVLAGVRVERWLAPLAPGTRPDDWWPLAAAVTAVIAAALAASMVPAVRAARIDPWKAIRHPE